jgi:3D (Asp-Asp-Asp) domain-containing protein
MSRLNLSLPFLGMAGLLFVTACSLTGRSSSRITVLEANKTYELRPAIAANRDFEPNGMRSMYFVLRQDSPPVIGGDREDLRGPMAVRTTAYTHSESDHLIYGRKTALGSPLRFGSIRSAAADWSRFPLGTRFRIRSQPTVIYEVDDYGSALVGTNTIDLYCPTRGMMNNWGVRHVDIDVVQWGSYARSADIMKDRVHYAHVRRMLNDINLRELVQKEANQQKSAPAPYLRRPSLVGPLRPPYLAMF